MCLVADYSVSRKLFRDEEHRDNLRESSGRPGAAIPQSTSPATTGIPSPFLSTVPARGEGDPTPILVGVGTSQGIFHTTQFVGILSPLVSIFVAHRGWFTWEPLWSF